MYLEKIKLYMEGNEYIMPQLPVKLSNIAEAERKLKVNFPEELKEMLMEMNGDKYLLFSADQIVETNLETREYLSEDYKGLDELLFVAGNGCGDYYAYIIENGKISTTKMVRWEHEDNSKISVANSLIEMIDKYYNDEI